MRVVWLFITFNEREYYILYSSHSLTRTCAVFFERTRFRESHYQKNNKYFMAVCFLECFKWSHIQVLCDVRVIATRVSRGTLIRLPLARVNWLSHTYASQCVYLFACLCATYPMTIMSLRHIICRSQNHLIDFWGKISGKSKPLICNHRMFQTFTNLFEFVFTINEQSSSTNRPDQIKYEREQLKVFMSSPWFDCWVV